MHERTDDYTPEQLSGLDATLARMRMRALACLGGGKRLRGAPDVLRVAHKIDIPDFEPATCWTWTGAKDRKGYGYARTNTRESPRTVYRFVWEALAGTIPAKWHVDHLCENPSCCRPSHIEPVPHGENIRRGVESRQKRKALAKFLKAS